MKEIKAGLFGKNNKIYEFELADLAQLRKTVFESWPVEGYLLQESGKTYMITKHLMISLIKEAEKSLANNGKTIKNLEENLKTEKGRLENQAFENKQVEILQKLETVEQQLSAIPNLFKRSSEEHSYGNKSSSKMFEYLDSEIRDIQENLSINSDRINKSISSMASNIKEIEESLSHFSELSLELENVDKGSVVTNVEEDDISSLLRELYRTSCEMNKVILDTALKYIMDEPVRK